MGENERKEGKGDAFFFRKAWEVLFPYLLYYLAYNAAYLILAFLYQALNRFGGAFGQAVAAYETTVAGVVGGLCSLIGILPLVPMLKKELKLRAAEDTEGVEKETGMMQITKLTEIVILTISLSLGLNAFLTMTGFAESSAAYQQVADRQYGVAFGLGLVLYGMISPLAEEVIFRGVIYNRLRRSFSPAIGIVASAFFFGLFHGNLVQGVYGTAMGIFMAYLYERSGRFVTPVLFHAAANLSVYTVAHLPEVQEALFTPVGCAALLAVAAGCLLLGWKK